MLQLLPKGPQLKVLSDSYFETSLIAANNHRFKRSLHKSISVINIFIFSYDYTKIMISVHRMIKHLLIHCSKTG